MGDIDELLDNNAAYAASFDPGELDKRPRRHMAIVSCMDARLDIYRMLGLRAGDAHVIRNAGGVVTDDVIRSLAVSQRKLGTAEIVLIHHTDCGMMGLDEAAERAAIEDEAGVRLPFALRGFADAYDDVHHSIRLLELSPFLPHKAAIRGFVYDDCTGRLQRVAASP